MPEPLKELQLLVKPVSSACNLSCVYCFYRGVPRRIVKGGVMSRGTLEAMIGSFLGLGQETSVFSWQGGEPTLAGLDFYKEAVKLQARLGSAGQAVGNSIQTNGLLLDRAWAKFLARYRFLVGLSLDGPEAVHDRYRRNSSRGPSHAAVLAAARLLREWDIPFSILVAVHRHGRAQEVYPWLREQGFDSLQFIPIVERGGAPGPMAEFSVEPGGYGEFLCEAFDRWWPDRGRMIVRDFDSVARGLAGLDPGSCVLGSSCDSYLVVEADGQAYPCDFFVRREWRLGNVRESSLRGLSSSALALEFARGKGDLADACRACRWADLCRGGCQKDRERAGDRRGQSYLCAGLKMFYEHAVPRLGQYVEESRPATP